MATTSSTTEGYGVSGTTAEKRPEKPYEVGPDWDEVEEWAERERRRRNRWTEGPTEREKRAWARREHRRRLADAADDDLDDDCEDPEVRRARRDAAYATLGAWHCLMTWPYRAWADFVRQGREVEAECYGPSRRRRVLIRDDD